MFNYIIALGVFLMAFLCVAVLRKTETLDVPNQRSSHETPTPSGGGLGFVSVICMALSLYHIFFTYDFYGVIYALLIGIFMMIGFMDDRIQLSAKFRFSIHILLVAIYFFFLAPFFPYFEPFVPEWVINSVLFFGLLWFINLYNFMDGIDGITSLQTLWILLGLGLLSPIDPTLLIIYASAIIGFSYWNLPPAKIFMGDSGSISLGFIAGTLLIENAQYSLESFFVSLILPLYYIMDASITLVKRLLKGHKPWEAHREHFYQQRATSDKKTHKTVLIMISICNACLLMWAYLVPILNFYALIGAFVTVLICLKKLKRNSKSI